MQYSITAKYLFYDLDSGQASTESRKWKQHVGKISDLTEKIKGRPLDVFEIHFVSPQGELKDFIKLSKVLKKCFKLGKPYLNNMY